MSLRKIYKNLDKYNKTAIELKQIIENKFSDEKLFEGFCELTHGCRN
jgi:hypothetical protein